MTNGGGLRLTLTDTDSLAIATERELSSWEKWLHTLLLKTNQPTPYRDTYIGQELSSHTYRSWRPILDYSSISETSTLYHGFFSQTPELKTMFKYLSIVQRKKLLKWQNETNFSECTTILSPCPKSYCLNIMKDFSLPLSRISPIPYPSLGRNDPLNVIPSDTFVKKSKGIKKSILHFRTSVIDYANATKTDQPTRSVQEYGLRKKHMKIFLISQSKLLMRKSVVKRLCYEKSRQCWSFFTFPLCFNRLLDLP